MNEQERLNAIAQAFLAPANGTAWQEFVTAEVSESLRIKRDILLVEAIDLIARMYRVHLEIQQELELSKQVPN